MVVKEGFGLGGDPKVQHGLASRAHLCLIVGLADARAVPEQSIALRRQTQDNLLLIHAFLLDVMHCSAHVTAAIHLFGDELPSRRTFPKEFIA